jgi:hypothetical protein
MSAIRTTRLGKTVGSIKAPLFAWTYWADTNRAGKHGFSIVAPSGARMDWVATETEAKRRVAEEQAEWDALAR